MTDGKAADTINFPASHRDLVLEGVTVFHERGPGLPPPNEYRSHRVRYLLRTDHTPLYFDLQYRDSDANERAVYRVAYIAEPVGNFVDSGAPIPTEMNGWLRDAHPFLPYYIGIAQSGPRFAPAVTPWIRGDRVRLRFTPSVDD